MIRSIYRILLRLYPSGFRDEYEPEMLWAFDLQLTRARGRRERAGLLARVVADVLVSATQERIANKEVAMQSIAGGGTSVAVTEEFRAGRNLRAIALSPLWIGLPLEVILPGHLELLWTSPPDIIGIPAGLVFAVVSLGWMAIGAAALWQTRFPVIAALAITFFAIPSLFLLVVGTALLRVVMASA